MNWIVEDFVGRLGSLDFVLRAMRSPRRISRRKGAWPDLLLSGNRLMGRGLGTRLVAVAQS